MKFRFKIQQYQTDAVNAIADVFKGQPYQAYAKYTMDMGVAPQKQTAQLDLFGGVKGGMRLYQSAGQTLDKENKHKRDTL